MSFEYTLLEARVPTHTWSYHKRWVQSWLEFQDENGNQTPIKEFIRNLGTRGLAPWQCQQAQRAVQLWEGLVIQSTSDAPPPTKEETKTWKVVLRTMEENLRAKRYSPFTIRAYLDWAARLSKAHPHPPSSGEEASSMVQTFLDHLALAKNLAPASIAQARNAFAWLIRRELGLDLVLKAKGAAHHSKRLPRVLAPSVVSEILEHCPAPWDLFFSLQYGCGLRLGELLNLRIQDVDLDRSVVMVRSGKGDKDRQIPLPQSLHQRVEMHLAQRKELWAKDLEAGWAQVDLPHALNRKTPTAVDSWEWQHLFGSPRPLRHPVTGIRCRWRPMETNVREALKDAAARAGVTGRIHPHLLRHCYATHLVEMGLPLIEIQELMGHARIDTTMIYLHVRSLPEKKTSPLDRLRIGSLATPSLAISPED